MTCPANVTTETPPGQNLVTIALPDVTSALDDSGVVKITAALNGSPYPYNYDVGEEVTLSLARSPHLWRYTATDESYNMASCDMYIIVVGQ